MSNKDRFQLVIPKTTLAKVRELSVVEQRTVSNMIAVLIEEAIAARLAKKES